MTNIGYMRKLTTIILLSFFLLSCSEAKVKEYKLEVVAEYPHDRESYTQGLFFHEGKLYEMISKREGQK